MSRISDKESSWEPPTDEADSKEESEDINNEVTTKKQEKSDSENYEEFDFSKNDCNSNTETIWQRLNRMSQI